MLFFLVGSTSRLSLLLLWNIFFISFRFIQQGGTANQHSTRCELAVVMYAANVLGSRGPRKMQVAIPGFNLHNCSSNQCKDT